MSDLMLHGKLNMPLPDEPQDCDVVTWVQFKAAAKEAADRIEELEALLRNVQQQRRLCVDQNLLLEAKLSASYTRAQIEAAVKRALEGAGKYLDEMALQNGYTKTPRGRTAMFYARKVRALDPALFIDGDKQ